MGVMVVLVVFEEGFISGKKGNWVSRSKDG